MIAWILAASQFVQSPSSATAPPKPEARALESLTLDFAQLGKLERANTLVYDFVVLEKAGKAANPIGTLHTYTRVEGDRVLLIDVWTLSNKEKERKLTVTQVCNQDNMLSLVSIGVNGDGDEEVVDLDLSIRVADPATVKQGVIWPDDGEKTLALPPQTLTDGALLRIVSLLPREKGLRVSFPFWLESAELNLKKDHLIECRGPDPITIGGRTVKCTKYAHSGGGITGSTLWVDEEGLLQRILVDGRKELTLRPTETETSKSGPVKQDTGGK